MTFIYYVLACLAHIIATPAIIILSFKQKYRNSLRARFLFAKNHSKESYDFWLHACSLGEVSSLKPIVDSIPSTKSIFLTVITNTGFTKAYNLFGNRKNLSIEYLPFESLLPLVAPTCKNLLVFEAEIWLMLFFHAKRLGAKTKLINARISKRSFKRYLMLKNFYKHIFLHIDYVLAQSNKDLSRLKLLGANNIHVIGNIKILSTIKPSKLYTKPKRLIVLAASTHDKEEELILESFIKFRNIYNKKKSNETKKGHYEYKSSKPNPLLIIAPRHPERFGIVYNLCAKSANVNCWSDWITNTQCNEESSKETLDNIQSDILLIDTLGELINLYAISDIVILAGSFEKIGGHNPLEPATFDNVLISGKEIFNQQALFSCVENYYLVSKNELTNKLSLYPNLHKSRINVKIIDNMLKTIID
ncbi:3-deoxy-D-manno-octulosonic acid transferase [Helicobacter muridarum]|uniref:3-deoxy-D-manno-octulosonic acid transferase n=1 Tax=Helicobacter muridarum TaxID=216 RepID=A0A099U2D5_9HELI|nr:lipid IV(A) 3-deoxy-D-manno-octulosonic acid transferase [Helicobacter muridarum]TLE01712.1 3-deoxy-D-manno-octulosonic acid transferase [Helicobacter muridarum]STQ86357.1 3-deoxy-D-manno-octulosonic-acid transferase [Helicobacter muridarum]